MFFYKMMKQNETSTLIVFL